MGKDGDQVTREKERPLTIEGFENYCFEIVGDVHHYFDNTDGRYSDYGTVCSYIKNQIRQDQIEGGMAGMFNPSITQRLNNLAEKQEIEHGGAVKILSNDPLA